MWTFFHSLLIYGSLEKCPSPHSLLQPSLAPRPQLLELPKRGRVKVCCSSIVNSMAFICLCDLVEGGKYCFHCCFMLKYLADTAVTPYLSPTILTVQSLVISGQGPSCLQCNPPMGVFSGASTTWGSSNLTFLGSLPFSENVYGSCSKSL